MTRSTRIPADQLLRPFVAISRIISTIINNYLPHTVVPAGERSRGQARAKRPKTLMGQNREIGNFAVQSVVRLLPGLRLRNDPEDPVRKIKIDEDDCIWRAVVDEIVPILRELNIYVLLPKSKQCDLGRILQRELGKAKVHILTKWNSSCLSTVPGCPPSWAEGVQNSTKNGRGNSFHNFQSKFRCYFDWTYFVRVYMKNIITATDIEWLEKVAQSGMRILILDDTYSSGATMLWLRQVVKHHKISEDLIHALSILSENS
jgi:hypothetical protein